MIHHYPRREGLTNTQSMQLASRAINRATSWIEAIGVIAAQRFLTTHGLKQQSKAMHDKEARFFTEMEGALPLMTTDCLT